MNQDAYKLLIKNRVLVLIESSCGSRTWFIRIPRLHAGCSPSVLTPLFLSLSSFLQFCHDGSCELSETKGRRYVSSGGWSRSIREELSNYFQRQGRLTHASRHPQIYKCSACLSIMRAASRREQTFSIKRGITKFSTATRSARSACVYVTRYHGRLRDTTLISRGLCDVSLSLHDTKVSIFRSSRTPNDLYLVDSFR